MGCGLGPLHIKRHDSLRDIIWQALLVDNPRAAREQPCGVDNSRPGDIFHPDFVQGKPAYFDVSVRNSLQPQFLCRAASLAGAAGEAGEMAKDARHEEGVIAAGGVFFPLVVETLGLWTTHSLKTLSAHRHQSLGTQWYHQRSGSLQPASTTLCEALVPQLKVGYHLVGELRGFPCPVGPLATGCCFVFVFVFVFVFIIIVSVYYYYYCFIIIIIIIIINIRCNLF